MLEATLNQHFGFIGLGAMGFPMALNLAKKRPGLKTINIYDVSLDHLKRAAAAADCFNICSSAREVAEKSDIILTMVNEGSHVRAVYLTQETGILASSNLRNKYFFDCSTIDFATSLHIAKEMKKAEPTATFYDTPVSGGVIGAEAGTLAIMVGCIESSPDWPLIVEVFQYMALKEKIVPAGGPGLGIVAKLCNNYIAAIICLGTTEAFNWGMKAGMDPRKLRDIIIGSSGSSNHAIQHLAVPRVCPESAASREYRPGFRTELAVKDVKLAQESAVQAGAKMVLIDSALDTFSKVAKEHPGMDFRIMYKWLGGDMDWDSHLAKEQE